jgi:hypothetical protein
MKFINSHNIYFSNYKHEKNAPRCLQCNPSQHRVCSTLTSRQMRHIFCSLLILSCSIVSNNIISFKIIGICIKYARNRRSMSKQSCLFKQKPFPWKQITLQLFSRKINVQHATAKNKNLVSSVLPVLPTSFRKLCNPQL